MRSKTTLYLVTFIGSLILLSVLALQPRSTTAQAGLDLQDYRGTMIRMVGEAVDARQQAGNGSLFITIGNSGDPLYIAPLIDVMYFVRTQDASQNILGALQNLTDNALPGASWQDYFRWAGENDIDLPPHYDEFKGLLLSMFVDPEFTRFWQPGVMDTAQVNLIEAVWGGVRVDGIPSLVNAKQITPEEAQLEGETLTQYCNDGDCSYPAPDEFVFGVTINGDSRAYPLRLLNWHEMFNDVIGHTPMYDSPNGEQVCNFRAPTEFSAIAQADDGWVLIEGESAGCPEQGWISTESIQWADEATWEDVSDMLPDENDALNANEGIRGQVRGKPVMLAYCTLCGAGILYDVTIPELSYTDNNGNLIELGETVLEFGSTGMLMRSNKLMYDRNTDTVWNAITGEPAFGVLAESGIVLDILPVVVTDWASWLAEHPDTSVLSLQTGFRRTYVNGEAYNEYFNNPDFIMFPVWQQDTSQNDNKDMIFALKINDTKKAYPLATIIPETSDQ